MKIEDIYIGKKISEHIYHFHQEIEPEDLLKVIRFLASQGKRLGYDSTSRLTFYTHSDYITKDEFDYVYANTDEKLDYWLDNFTREELVSRVNSAIKIISSTTKTEIIQKILKDKDIIFRFFKKEFIEKYCSKWSEFKKGKVFLPAVSDKTRTIVFSISSKYDTLSGRDYLQYWYLGDSYPHLDSNKQIETEIIGNCMSINLKDNDGVIIKTMQRFSKKNDKNSEIGLHCIHQEISDEDLEIQKPDRINYYADLYKLASYFSVRKVSIFETLCEGLKRKIDKEKVKEFLGKKFLVVEQKENIYPGTGQTQELFEKLAWHLKIEYLKGKRILCKVVEQETQETITALWEITNDSYLRSFYFIEL
ncbi:MAG: hypothetical protein ABIL44_00975 [candidate division WOR-3 bacterium]